MARHAIGYHVRFLSCQTLQSWSLLCPLDNPATSHNLWPGKYHFFLPLFFISCECAVITENPKSPLQISSANFLRMETMPLNLLRARQIITIFVMRTLQNLFLLFENFIHAYKVFIKSSSLPSPPTPPLLSYHLSVLASYVFTLFGFLIH